MAKLCQLAGRCVTGWSRLHREPITHSPDSDDLLAKRAKLLAQPGDMGINRAIEAVIVIAPQPLQQKLAAECTARVTRKEQQQLKFLGGQIKVSAIKRRRMCRLV